MPRLVWYSVHPTHFTCRVGVHCGIGSWSPFIGMSTLQPSNRRRLSEVYLKGAEVRVEVRSSECTQARAGKPRRCLLRVAMAAINWHGRDQVRP